MNAKIQSILSFVLLSFAFFACQDDDLVTLQGFNEDASIELIATKDQVELAPENSSDLALQFAWDIPDFTLSEYSLAANAMTTELQFALDSIFSETAGVSVSGASCSFTAGTLNSAVSGLGAEADVSSLFYVRLALYAGNNIDPVYSNVLEINITPYAVDHTVMYLSTGTSASDMFASLYDPDDSGLYTGFVSTSSGWLNFYFIGGDGTVYGNVAASGTAFNLTSSSSMWNCWFPATSGCHYVTMSTADMAWTATWVSGITVSGDGTGTLSYSSSAKQWSGTVTTTAANANLILTANGQRYDKDTGDAAYSAYSFYLSGDNSGSADGSLSFSETGTEGYILVPEAGTYTLTLTLTDPEAYTYSLSEGGSETPDLPDQLYLHDRSDAETYYATLNVRTENVYECFYSGSAWQNFYFTSETSMSEGTIYGYTGSDQYVISSLAASAFSSDDLWAFWFDSDVANYYFIQANLSENTWEPQIVNGFYVTGGFNGWSTSANAMTYDSGTKTWTATCVMDAIDEYGIQILPDIEGQDDIWSNKMASVDGGAEEGELDWYSRTGNTNIPVSETGTYVITIDLNDSGKYTYTIQKQ